MKRRHGLTIVELLVVLANTCPLQQGRYPGSARWTDSGRARRCVLMHYQIVKKDVRDASVSASNLCFVVRSRRSARWLAIAGQTS